MLILTTGLHLRLAYHVKFKLAYRPVFHPLLNLCTNLHTRYITIGYCLLGYASLGYLLCRRNYRLDDFTLE